MAEYTNQELLGLLRPSQPAQPLPQAVPSNADLLRMLTPAQPEGSVRATIEAGFGAMQPWGTPQPRRLDPRTMDDDALLTAIGRTPEQITLIKQSQFYTPGSIQNALITPESAGERVMRSPIGSFMAGVRRPLDWGTQVAARGASALGLTSPADVALTDAITALKRAEYEQGQPGKLDIPVLGPVDPAEMVGNAVVPLPGTRGVWMPKPGGSVLGNAARMVGNATGAGAVGGAAQPVYQPGLPGGQDDTFWAQTGQQAATGAAMGAAMGTALAAPTAVLRYSRAGRAITKADWETKAQLEQAVKDFDVETLAYEQRLEGDLATRRAQVQNAQTRARQQSREQFTQWDRDVQAFDDDITQRLALRRAAEQNARTAAREETQRALEAWESQGREEYQKALAKAQEAQARWRKEMDAYTADLEGRLVQRRSLVETAEREAAETNAANRQTHEAQRQSAYAAGQAEAKARQAQYRENRQASEMATAQHQAAVSRVQQLPRQYLPKAPARNLDDVWQDMRVLDKGGAEAEELVKALGADDIFDASIKLQAESDTLAQTPGAGTMVPAGDVIPPSYQQPRLPGMQDPRLELQGFIRQRGNIKLTGETDIPEELQALISPREVGRRSSLLNNQSGKSLDQMAQAAAEAGYIREPDKFALLDALRESQGGKPVYSLADAVPEALLLPGQPAPMTNTPTRSVSTGVHGRGSASNVLYGRLEQVAKSSPVDLSPLAEPVQLLKQELGFGVPSMQPTRLERLLDDLANMGANGSVKQVHEALKDIGPLTRNSSAKVRYASKGLIKELHNAMEVASLDFPETEYARKLLKAANEAWKQEEGVYALGRALRQSGPVLTPEPGSGNYLLNVRNLLKVADNQEILDWFPPAQQEALRRDLRSFAGTPAMPKGPIPLPGSVPVRDIGSPPLPVELRYPRPVTIEVPPEMPDAAPLPGMMTMQRLQRPEPVEPAYQRPISIGESPRYHAPEPVQPEYVSPVSVPPRPEFEPPPPVEPQVSMLGNRLLLEGMGPLVAGLVTGHGMRAVAVAGGLLTADALSYGLARALLSPQVRPLLVQAIQGGGRVPPELYAVIKAFAAEVNRPDVMPERK